MIVEVLVSRVWYGEPSETQGWRGDVTLYFVQPALFGKASGFFDKQDWFHHSRKRVALYHGRGL